MQDTISNIKRIRLTVQGQVQGVGFRPFVFVLAEDYQLTGLVQNSSLGVNIEIQGTHKNAQGFIRDLSKKLPPLAKISKIIKKNLPLIPAEKNFIIAKSLAGKEHNVLISPDMALCKECTEDMQNTNNRRFAYPFTNCTNCGPRYTITHSLPYDRDKTSMACFPMCKSCAEEYENPRNRRFHAQPNACPECGPHVWLVKTSDLMAGSDTRQHQAAFATTSQLQNPTIQASALMDKSAFTSLGKALVDGKIAAIKGLGGFHLACDATNEDAIALLRKRKNRPHKALAVMFGSLADASFYADISIKAAALLQSQQHPIVICPLRQEHRDGLPMNLAPDVHSLGIMLPYTPLHSCLFQEYAKIWQSKGRKQPPALVMTSGNMAGNPICLGNREALQELTDIADIFLLHNRDILIRVDDSVLFCDQELGTTFFRRARGYVPSVTPLPEVNDKKSREKSTIPPCVFGIGADLKNTLCLSKGNDAFVSQHIGDMENIENALFQQSIFQHLQKLLQVRPELVVCDMHPNFVTTQKARELNLPLLRLQHHFAHAHAVLAENNYTGKALVLALDGTGFAEDNSIWGGEFLLLDHTCQKQERLASLSPITLPGGEVAIREPWRIAHAFLWQEGLLAGNSLSQNLCPWLPEHEKTARIIPQMLTTKFNCSETTSAGRLFDLVSALLGICMQTTYEGQAAIRLESRQFGDKTTHYGGKHGKLVAKLLRLPREKLYPCSIEDNLESTEQRPKWRLNTKELALALVQDKKNSVAVKAQLFHASFAFALVDMAKKLCDLYGMRHVGLSGGCLQNITLAKLLVKRLKRNNLVPLWHTKLPPNDACISYGQVAFGRQYLAKNKACTPE